MDLLFVAADNIGGKLIRAFEGGRASHVGIVDGDSVIDATLNHGVARRPVEEFMRRRELIGSARIDLRDEASAIEFARSQVGNGYDWSGIIGFMMLRDWSDDGRWYCSELAATALMRGGVTIADRGRRFGVRLLREVAHAHGQLTV